MTTAAVPTAVLAMTGQSIWVDNITRAMLGGQLQEYIAKWSVVGLTSNPTIFAKAIMGSKDYDAQVAELAARGMAQKRPSLNWHLPTCCTPVTCLRVFTSALAGWMAGARLK